MHGEPLGRDITALDRVAGWRAGVPCLCELAFGLPMNLLQSLTETPRRKKNKSNVATNCHKLNVGC